MQRTGSTRSRHRARSIGLFPFRLFRLPRANLPQLDRRRSLPPNSNYAASIRTCFDSTGRCASPASAPASFPTPTGASAARRLLLRACCPDLRLGFPLCIERERHQQERRFVRGLSRRAGRSTAQAPSMSATIRRRTISRAHAVTASRRCICRRPAPCLGVGPQPRNLAAKLLCPSKPSMLDGGMRTLRRLVASRCRANPPAFDLGRTRSRAGDACVRCLHRRSRCRHRRQRRSAPASHSSVATDSCRIGSGTQGRDTDARSIGDQSPGQHDGVGRHAGAADRPRSTNCRPSTPTPSQRSPNTGPPEMASFLAHCRGGTAAGRELAGGPAGPDRRPRDRCTGRGVARRS